MAWTKVKRTPSAGLDHTDYGFFNFSEETAGFDKELIFDTDIIEGGAFRVDGVRVEYAADSTVITRTAFTWQLRDTGDSDDVLSSYLLPGTDYDVIADGNETFELVPGLPVNALQVLTAVPKLVWFPRNLHILPGMDLRIFVATNGQAGDTLVAHVRGEILSDPQRRINI